MKETLEIEGYASRYDEADLGGDVVRRGAFSKKLMITPPDGVMMLYQHAAENPVGRWTKLEDRNDGLYARGSILLGTRLGRDLAVLLTGGAISGLSIGFKPTRTRRRPGGGRDILELQLWEISIVSFPMANRARIVRVGSIN